MCICRTGKSWFGSGHGRKRRLWRSRFFAMVTLQERFLFDWFSHDVNLLWGTSGYVGPAAGGGLLDMRIIRSINNKLNAKRSVPSNIAEPLYFPLPMQFRKIAFTLRQSSGLVLCAYFAGNYVFITDALFFWSVGVISNYNSVSHDVRLPWGWCSRTWRSGCGLGVNM